jgi:nucleotide-binding universal stress UspA family protein
MATHRTARARKPGYRRILWPTDFSPIAKAALPHALKIAREGGELIVLHVVSPTAAYPPGAMAATVWTTLEAEMRAAAKEQLDRATAIVKARAGGLRIRSLLVYGSPFHQIPQVAKRLRCDLIVLATHGHTGLRHVLLGSVAENVVRHAQCPVLTVRPPRAAPSRARS